MQTPGLAALRHLSLPPYERKVLDVLINAYPRYLSISAIVDRIYADDPNGGPHTADNAVAVYLNRLRPKLAEYGWTAGRLKHHSAGIGLRQIEHDDAGVKAA
jgi:DNA-binding response OmpR family regulator